MDKVIRLGRVNETRIKQGLQEILKIGNYIQYFNKKKRLNGTYLINADQHCYFVQDLSSNAIESEVQKILELIEKGKYWSIDLPLLIDTSGRIRDSKLSKIVDRIKGFEIRKSVKKDKGRNAYYMVATNGDTYSVELSRKKPSNKNFITYANQIKKKQYVTPQSLARVKNIML